MTSTYSTRLFRIIFAFAGLYNLTFGVWAGFWPLQFFEQLTIAPPRYPEIWSCLGMVVGVYGLLYMYAAWKPELGKPIIAIGLLGKVLGPIGMAFSISDTWPVHLAILNLFNDVIWWLPFSLFLIRGTRFAKRIVAMAPWFCVGFHVLGVLAMIFVLRHGTLTAPSPTAQAMFIIENKVSWTIGWVTWMLSAASLVAFYAWWGSHLASLRMPTVAVMLAAIGSVCDMYGESISVLMLPGAAQEMLSDSSLFSGIGFVISESLSILLTAGAANFLYTVAGCMLMLQTDGLPKWVKLAMWGTWVSGVVMTVSAVSMSVVGMAAATTVLFPLLIAWTAWLGFHWRHE